MNIAHVRPTSSAKLWRKHVFYLRALLVDNEQDLAKIGSLHSFISELNLDHNELHSNAALTHCEPKKLLRSALSGEIGCRIQDKCLIQACSNSHQTMATTILKIRFQNPLLSNPLRQQTSEHSLRRGLGDTWRPDNCHVPSEVVSCCPLCYLIQLVLLLPSACWA